MIYSDHKVAYPVSLIARVAWMKNGELVIGNPASLHRLGAQADAR